MLELTCSRQGAFPDLALYREMASLTENVIAAGGGTLGVSAHHRKLVRYSKVLNNKERASEVVNQTKPLNASREVLLPAALSGREQIDARKDLIFKCTDIIIKAVYDLCEENAADLTDEEWEALKQAENVVATVYGQAFSDYFVLAENAYKGVHGALQQGHREEAVQRLRRIVAKLQALETVPIVNNPLMRTEQFDALCMNLHAMYSIQLEAIGILERVVKDFQFDDIPSYRQENAEFDAICDALTGLLDSDGGLSRIDCW